MIMKKLSNLSKLILLLILLFCSATQSRAQFRRHHMKANLTTFMIPPFGRYEMGYEYRLNNHWSLEGSLGLIRSGVYSLPSGVGRTTDGTYQYEDGVGGSFLLFFILLNEKPYYEVLHWEKRKKNGGIMMLGTRWYAQSSINRPQHGFYVGMNLVFYTYGFDQYQSFTKRDPAIWKGNLLSASATQQVTETVTHEQRQQSAVGGKVDIGWQWIIKKKVALDLYLSFGAQYRRYQIQDDPIYTNTILDAGLKMGILWD